MNKFHLLEFTLSELEEYFSHHHQPPYRARQVFGWVFHQTTFDFQLMSNLPQKVRHQLTQEMTIMAGSEVIRQKAHDGTLKLLLQFENPQSTSPHQVETVLIPEQKRHTACLSTQFGCPIKCTFCATGQGPFLGNLTTGQIIEQALRLQKILNGQGQRLSHIVFMGMGEPFLNYEATLKAIRILHAPWGLGISARRITLSTVGLPAAIRRLASEELPVNLAISLHSPWQEKREKIIPLAVKYPLKAILEAAHYYFQKTGREVTLEYLMLPEFNLSPADARELAALARQISANVNLIPYNPTRESQFRSPQPKEIRNFLRWLRQLKIKAHVRRSRGSDIEAACGQLRQRNAAPP